MNGASQPDQSAPDAAAAAELSHMALNDIASLAGMALAVLNHAVLQEDTTLVDAAACQVRTIGFIADAAIKRMGHTQVTGDAEHWLMSPMCRQAFDPAGGAE